MDKVLRLADEPSRGLVHGFQHEHAGHERQLRKMVFQAPLVTGQMEDGFDMLARFELRDLVDE